MRRKEIEKKNKKSGRRDERRLPRRYERQNLKAGRDRSIMNKGARAFQRQKTVRDKSIRYE